MAIGAIVAGLARGVGGAVSANQRKQRNKGLIGKAYAQGRERLNLLQGDTRQGFGEGLVARGLHLGGNVRASGPVKPEQEGVTATPTIDRRFPGPQMGGLAGMKRIRTAYAPRTNPTVDLTQASDLGGQQQADLQREQQLEQNELRTAYENAIENNDAMGFQDVVSNLAAGVDTATGFGGALDNLNSVNSVQSAFGNAIRNPTPYPNAWGPPGLGPVDPVRPLERGAWATTPPASSDFNVFSQENRDRRG